MGGGVYAAPYPFRLEIEKWRAVGGGVDRNGNILKEPWELQRAKMIDGLCQRYGCLPSQLLEEDMDTLFRTHTVLYLAGEVGGENTEQSKMQSKLDKLANMSQRL